MHKWSVVVTVCVCALVCATAAHAASIRDRPEYRPSSDIALFDSTYYTGLTGANPGYNGGVGFRLTPFQFNLIYQSGIADSEIEAFDDYDYPNLNFPDGDTYFLRIATEEAGPLPIGIWGTLDGTQEYGPDHGESWVDWTISGWWDNSGHTIAEYHTILAGTIETVGGQTYLQIRPPGSYRPFPWDSFVNNVEVFTGYPIEGEVAGYFYDAAGGNLEVQLIPEPLTLLGLGLGLAGLGRYCRRRFAF